MLSDKSIIYLKKLGYQHLQADLKEFVALLGNGFYKISGGVDVRPFLVYFIENVYHELVTALPPNIAEIFQNALNQSKVTEKEPAL